MSDDIIRIAITGKMRSGKTTAAKHLCMNYDFKILSFGEPIKRIADEYFKHLYEPIYENCPFSDNDESIAGYKKPRKLLQQIGQLFRQIDEDVWIKRAEQTMQYYELYRDTRGIVIDDLRQPNEYEWARANGFVIIRINAPDELRIERAKAAGDDFDEADLTHETERYIDGFAVDYEIDNAHSLEELERQIDEIIAKIKTRQVI